MYNPNNQTIYYVDGDAMSDFCSQYGWVNISWDTPKTNISNLAWETTDAWRKKQPYTKPFSTSGTKYSPNHVYQNPTPTDFQLYFAAERAKGRTPEQIYRDNSFLIPNLAYTAPPPQPVVTIASSSPAPLTYTWNVPFRSGLTQAQKDSITNMLTNRTNAGEILNETDARNYAYAVGRTEWQKYVG